jgi:hypothetical protein
VIGFLGCCNLIIMLLRRFFTLPRLSKLNLPIPIFHYLVRDSSIVAALRPVTGQNACEHKALVQSVLRSIVSDEKANNNSLNSLFNYLSENTSISLYILLSLFDVAQGSSYYFPSHAQLRIFSLIYSNPLVSYHQRLIAINLIYKSFLASNASASIEIVEFLTGIIKFQLKNLVRHSGSSAESTAEIRSFYEQFLASIITASSGVNAKIMNEILDSYCLLHNYKAAAAFLRLQTHYFTEQLLLNNIELMNRVIEIYYQSQEYDTALFYYDKVRNHYSRALKQELSYSSIYFNAMRAAIQWPLFKYNPNPFHHKQGNCNLHRAAEIYNDLIGVSQSIGASEYSYLLFYYEVADEAELFRKEVSRIIAQKHFSLANNQMQLVLLRYSTTLQQRNKNFTEELLSLADLIHHSAHKSIHPQVYNYLLLAYIYCAAAPQQLSNMWSDLQQLGITLHDTTANQICAFYLHTKEFPQLNNLLNELNLSVDLSTTLYKAFNKQVFLLLESSSAAAQQALQQLCFYLGSNNALLKKIFPAHLYKLAMKLVQQVDDSVADRVLCAILFLVERSLNNLLHANNNAPLNINQSIHLMLLATHKQLQLINSSRIFRLNEELMELLRRRSKLDQMINQEMSTSQLLSCYISSEHCNSLVPLEAASIAA